MSYQSGLQRSNTILIIRIACVVFFVAAICVGIIAPRSISAETAKVNILEPLDITQLESAQPGATVLVEAQISPKTAREIDDFVAYWRQKPKERTDRDSSSSDEWETEFTVTPPLILDLAGNQVRVTNDDYSLGSVSNWQQIDFPEGRRRIGGLRVGDPVVAIATVRSNSDGINLEASVVSQGTKASYLAGQRIFWWVAVGLGIACAIASVILGFIGFRPRPAARRI